MKELLQKQFDLKTAFQNWDVRMPSNFPQWILTFFGVIFISKLITPAIIYFSPSLNNSIFDGIASILFLGLALSGLYLLQEKKNNVPARLLPFKHMNILFDWHSASFLMSVIFVYLALSKPATQVTTGLIVTWLLIIGTLLISFGFTFFKKIKNNQKRGKLWNQYVSKK